MRATLFATTALALASLPNVARAGARPASPLYEANCQSPSWSPDGGRLSWEVNDHEKRTVSTYVYTPGQGPPRRVMPGGRSASSSLTAGFSGSTAPAVAQELSWSPAATGRFVYSAATDSRDYDLFLDTGTPLAVAPGVDGGPSWSPDGKAIVFTSGRSGQGDLYLLDVGALDRPPRLLVSSPTTSEVFASWSPDSRRLVFVSHTEQGDEIQLVSDLASPSPRALTSWGHTQTRPRFSPDGAWIAFYSNHLKSDRFDLYVMPSSGGEPKLIASGVVLNSRGPSWTPDSSRLVYVLDDDNRLDPVMSAPLNNPTAAVVVATGTVGNGDTDVARGTDGKVWLAVAAQGKVGDESRTFKRIYVMELP